MDDDADSGESKHVCVFSRGFLSHDAARPNDTPSFVAGKQRSKSDREIVALASRPGSDKAHRVRNKPTEPRKHFNTARSLKTPLPDSRAHVLALRQDASS